MKKKLLLLFVFSLCLNAVSSLSHTAVAQSRGTITFSVVDSLSREPVGYAAVLLYPEKDTVAAYYGQTDIDGKVTIDKIKKGVYTVRTELLGYVTRTQKVSVEGGTQDLGTIAMQEDYKMLEGAKVTATGNSIIIKQDTIEYIASSVKLGTNAVLLDLLKKLPGIEVDEDGNVKAQGETITRITLNGKTFFLNDPSIATDNIPANIIEKVRVIDKKSEQAIFSGIEDDNKEKVIDVKTYSGMGDGWIGNFTGGLGTDLPAANKESIFENTSDLRYNGSAMLGRIQDKNQIFFIGGGNNVNEGAFGRRNRGGMGGGSG
ncbi:MAG: carboxypeptidase regulatory-like domain-containing protein, partial [Bacteroidales bacterium]|nr:carboxypeptidase regulatory-like domain-containing protein [Bacteroidales bacterium]